MHSGRSPLPSLPPSLLAVSAPLSSSSRHATHAQLPAAMHSNAQHLQLQNILQMQAQARAAVNMQAQADALRMQQQQTQQTTPPQLPPAQLAPVPAPLPMHSNGVNNSMDAQQQQQQAAMLYAQLLAQQQQQSAAALPTANHSAFAFQQYLQVQAQAQMAALMQQQQQQQQLQQQAQVAVVADGVQQMTQQQQLAQWFTPVQLQQLALLAQQQALQQQQPQMLSFIPNHAQLPHTMQSPYSQQSQQQRYPPRHMHNHSIPHIQPIQQIVPSHMQSMHATPLVAQAFTGGPGSVLLVEGLEPVVAHAPQINADILFTLFGVYGDVMRVKLKPAANSPTEGAMPSVSTALLQFMNRDQAAVALQNLNGVRVLGVASRAMRISVAGEKDSFEDEPNQVVWPVKDYSTHAGHRFKYISCKNSKHICAPCPALHVSGLSLQVGEQDLREFFNGILHARTAASSVAAAASSESVVPAVVNSVVTFGREKKMAFVVCSSLDAALACLVFGHNQKLRGKFLRITFSHAKEHQHGGAGVIGGSGSSYSVSSLSSNGTHYSPSAHQPHSPQPHHLYQQQSLQVSPSPNPSAGYLQPHSPNYDLYSPISSSADPGHSRSLSQESRGSTPSYSAHRSPHPLVSTGSSSSISSTGSGAVDSIERQLLSMGINVSSGASSAYPSPAPSPSNKTAATTAADKDAVHAMLATPLNTVVEGNSPQHAAGAGASNSSPPPAAAQQQ